MYAWPSRTPRNVVGSLPIARNARLTIVPSRKTTPEPMIAATSVHRWVRVIPAVWHRRGYALAHAGSRRPRRVGRVPARDGRLRRGTARLDRPRQAPRGDPADGVLAGRDRGLPPLGDAGRGPLLGAGRRGRAGPRPRPGRRRRRGPRPGDRRGRSDLPVGRQAGLPVVDAVRDGSG